MTDPIRDALDAHFVTMHLYDDPAKPPGEWICSCGKKFGFSESVVEHQTIWVRLALASREASLADDLQVLHHRAPVWVHADDCPDPEAHEWADDASGETCCTTCEPVGWTCAECAEVAGWVDGGPDWPCATGALLDVGATRSHIRTDNEVN